MIATPADHIPDELKARPQWVIWRKEERDGKPTKVLYQARMPLRCAKVNDPNTWDTYINAFLAADRKKFDGVGYVFAEDDPYVGVDLDRCLRDDGEVEPWAVPFVESLEGTYGEISPSGRGIKFIARGRLAGTGKRRNGYGVLSDGAIEVYDRGRFFTITADIWDENAAAVVDLSDEIGHLYTEVQKRPDKKPTKVSELFPASIGTDPLSRARAYLAKVDPAISGDRGHDQCFKAACKMVEFGLTEAEIYTLLATEFNPKCEPPWSERELAHKVKDAFKENADRFGAKLDDKPIAVVHVIDPDTGAIEKPTDPHRLARIVQKTIGLSVDGPHIKYWDEQWWAWDGLRWVTVSDAEMAARICCVLKAEFDLLVAGTDQPPRPISTGLIGNVAAALRGLCLVRKDLTPEQPAWLDAHKGPKPLECFATTTGIIHLPTLIAKGPTDPGAVMPLTPRFFSAAALDYGFDPSAPEPKHWLAFLKSIWPDDQESIDCLQEWFGLFLTAETRYQKILMVLGPKRAGKGTIANTLRSLVGYSNVVAPTLGSLATQFGLQALIGKRVAMTTDARLSGRVDSQQIVERLLSISGEDPQSIDRKHINAWHGTLNVRFALMGTELPRLGDVSGGLTGRMIVLCLKKTWLGNEDLELQARIRGELPGIQLWSIDGYHRLRERGRFLQPASGAEILEEFEELSNPVGVFLAEKCDLGPEHEVLKTDLYAGWQLWCKERGKEHISDQSGFGKNLRSALPSLKTPRHRDGVKIANYYGGVNLTESALMEVEEHRQQLEKLKHRQPDRRGDY